ncbi:MAG: hypothetical protein L6V87_06870 [Ruminococcus sp.]|nr:MAG: hypothetical protein L6V87_06870 [Ruminococcus sp.]
MKQKMSVKYVIAHIPIFPDVENRPQSSTDIIITDIDIIDDSDCTACANDDEKAEEISDQDFFNYNSAIKAQIDYERLCAECNKYDVDRIKDIILDVMLLQGIKCNYRKKRRNTYR